MFVTETVDIRVTANFKETQLARCSRPASFTIRIDAFGLSYQG